MSFITNTLEVVQRLESAGFPREQAEVLTYVNEDTANAVFVRLKAISKPGTSTLESTAPITDTVALAKRLSSAGFSKRKSEGLAKELELTAMEILKRTQRFLKEGY